MTTPGARLLGFLVLLVIMFAGAYAIGASVGPITISHAPSRPGGPMHMGSSGTATTPGRQLPAAGR